MLACVVNTIVPIDNTNKLAVLFAKFVYMSTTEQNLLTLITNILSYITIVQSFSQDIGIQILNRKDNNLVAGLARTSLQGSRE